MPRPRRTDLQHLDLDEHGVRVVLRQRTPGGAFQLDCADGLGGKRDRLSTGSSDPEQAREYGRRYIARVAEERLGLKRAVIDPNTLNLGKLFDLFRRDRVPLIKGKRTQGTYLTTMRVIEAHLRRSLPPSDFDQDVLDGYVKARGEGGATLALPNGGRRPLGPAAAGTITNDIEALSAIFNWARRKSVGKGVWLLDANPLARLRRPPREKNPRRPITSEQRYQVMLRYADEVDPLGRLRLMLVMARHTGRRCASIASLLVNDLLLDVERVRAALAEQADPRFPVEFADVWVHGGLRFRAEADKVGVSWVVPIGPQVAAAIREYLAGTPTPTLGDAPLFPQSRNLARALSAQGAQRLHEEAERAAREAGELLPKLSGGIWHPYRRLFRNERRRAGFHDREVAHIAGWIYTSPDAMNSHYLAYDPEELLAVVSYEPPQRAEMRARSHARSHTPP